ncbi:MAG TPA: hypothetical protein VME43_04135 [Bryobacteraceae bacterium]|nr:hypothetical protein [Bryobacteraceae bacterium]
MSDEAYGSPEDFFQPAIIRRIYTIVMDFEGTACATQIIALSVNHALQSWLDDLGLVGIYGLTDEQRGRLTTAVAESHWKVKHLQNLQNTWWVTITPDDGSMALLHVVETAVHSGMPPSKDP